MIRIKKHFRSIQSALPYRKAAQQQPKAPIDTPYGDKGHGHFTKNAPDTLGAATSVLRSKVRPDRFYVTGHKADPGGLHRVFIACLDASGKLDTTFNGSGMVDFNKGSGGFYLNAHAVAEDMSGNLLVTVEPHGETTTHLWKLTAEGEADPSFGKGKGYIDSRALFDVDLLLERLACHQNGLVATAVRSEAEGFKAVVVALDAHGAKDHGFGEDGLLALSTLIPESSSHALDGIAVISPAAGVQRIVISTTLRRGPDWYAVTSGLSLAGVLDDAFGERGHHWSDAWIINNGFSIEDSSKRITLYGQLYSEDDDSGQPTIYRLDYEGRPALEFNQGQVVRFHIDGGWGHIEEAEGGLIGYGSFYTFNMAVRYHSSGQLDTRFVPPYGYGQFGALLGEFGFVSHTDSMAIDTDNQRMLVSGQDVQQGYRIPCLLALSLKPVQ